MMELRDRLAAEVAASLAHSTLSPAKIARRAYALADAMLHERAQACFLDQERLPDEEAFLDDEVPFEDEDTERDALAREHEAHDPRWELSPRWSGEDLAALQARRAGPGLAKPAAERVDEDDRAGHTG